MTSNEVFKEVRHIINNNKNIQKPTLFPRWILNNYAHSIAVGIRRLSDKDTRSISLYKLIDDISKNREAITRSYYVSRYNKWMRKEGLADRDFDQFANKRDNILSLYQLQRDMNKLRKDTFRITRFVNKYIAHCDICQKRCKPPTFNDVDNVLKDHDGLYCK